MKLINCYIENFGKLSNFKLDFSEGLNTIKEENGYGKTTLTVFIKAMFYGLDATKRQKLECNDRKHYMPWQGGRCGGSLTFSQGARTYRIERSFMPRAADDTFLLYDSKSGNISTDYTENIGEELFSIDADGFERTVFLSEANLSGKNENKTISAKLSDLVGCDGDLSVMDEAIELLEKQRKVYYKRGGSGEIGELKEKLGQIERDISDLTRLKASYEEQKSSLTGMNARLSELREAKKKSDEQKLKSTYLKQYFDMQVVLEKEKSARDLQARFFEKGVPTPEEIESAREKFARAKQIDSAKSDDAKSEGYAHSSLFDVDVSETEYGKARDLHRKISEKNREKQILDGQISSFKEVPQNHLTVEEINLHIAAVKNISAKSSVSKGYLIFLPFAIFFLILGITLGILLSPMAYAICALSVIMIPMMLFAKHNAERVLSKMKAIEEARLALTELYTEPIPNDKVPELLYEARSIIAERERSAAELYSLKAKLSEISQEIAELEREACEFIARFKPTGCATVSAALDFILREREIYSALKKSNEASEKRRLEDLALSLEYKKAALDFISQFPYTTDRPFEEISTKLAEYRALCRSVARMEASIGDFMKSHGIDEHAEPPLDTQNQDASRIAEEIAELERTVAVTERQCAVMNETLGTKDELLAEAEELAERIADYERKLSVIQKTKALLGEAKDNLTSKYLSKTKSAFDKYVKLIGNESGADFSMNTSFSVMKEEHGALKESEAYSRGTRDLYALATRLALVDSLYESESPFIILDDPFAYFDDEKLVGAFKALRAIAREKQIIYLTCTKARAV